ncbi:phosphate ABC transporter permease PstA [Salinirubellus salinus]|uniref:Phosphate transport system permease protein PstA n=1 Tax=Salinirubellus salinus TaxID=1364945 RepID=A0A9E7R978_9EURY|nr:phosphate ABC transporter permease PstA [Salinirubellus salinus]UWM56783.1 phosphate ABC transporter permease PstA [Salinirubellus salinus]
MSTETRGDVIESFGEVSKRVGLAFRYLLLVATMFGIATLAVLLVFVFNDAVQPLTADPRWHLTFLLTFVLPSLGVGSYLYLRDDPGFGFGAGTVGLVVVSLLFSGGVAMIFVDLVDPIVWFAYTLAVAVPLGVVVLLQRESRRIGFFTRVGLTTLAFYVSLAGIPGPLGDAVGVANVVPSLANVVSSIPVLPVDWMLLLASVTLPLAVLVGLRARRLFDGDGRAGLVAGAGALALVAVAAVAGPAVGVDPIPATAVATTVLVPAGAYVGFTAIEHPERRRGLLLPAAVFGGALVGAVVVQQFGFAGPQSWVDWQFLTSAHSRNAEDAGLYPAIGGSILLMTAVAVLAFPLGVGAAVYLEEYAPDNRLTRFIDVNISNLAGVPSVVYGLLGLGVFVTYLGQPTGTVAIGGATLALLILPIVIISSREAIRSVPDEMRQASYGMGATKWQTVRRVVLPRAFPGILTGTILALGRAIGETAPLIMIGAPNVVFNLPAELGAKVSAMPLQVYAWASLFAGPDFYQKAVPAGVVVLVTVLLAMNSVAIVLRNRYQNEN